MAWWNFRREARMISEIPGIERPGANIIALAGLGDVALPTVTIDTALQVPAVWAAVNFLSRTLASVPLHLFKREKDGPKKISGGLQTLVHEAPNAEWTSFKLRQYFWQQVFTGGRGLIWIERSGSAVVGLWPINPNMARVKRDSLGRTLYDIGGRIYPASDIIDVPFMLKPDGLGHWGPIGRGEKAIQLALAMNEHGSKFFAGGGVPPLALEGPMPENADRAKAALEQVQRAIRTAKESGVPIFPMPPAHKLTQVGYDPEKSQMTDARGFQVIEIARLYSMPPVFLQDLSKGTFSNTEQQDLQLVKHVVGQWAQALEQEMCLKLFGQRNGNRYVEHNLDGLLRGDFKTRMEGLARAIQSGLLTPDEGRELDNRTAKGGNADKLFMQGATVPIDAPPKDPPVSDPPPADPLADPPEEDENDGN